jgi:outer membrane murein-binding lipoprotein Lpp
MWLVKVPVHERHIFQRTQVAAPEFAIGPLKVNVNWLRQTSESTTPMPSPPHGMFDGHVACPRGKGAWGFRSEPAVFNHFGWVAFSQERLHATVCSMTRDVGFVLFGVSFEVRYLSTKVENLSTKVDNLSTVVDNLSTKVENLSTKVDNLSTKVENLSTKVDNLSTVVDNLSTKVENLSTKVENLSTKVDNLSTKIDNLSTKIDNLSDNLSTKFDNLSTKLDNYMLVLLLILLCLICMICMQLTAVVLPNTMMTPPRQVGRQIVCGTITWKHLEKRMQQKAREAQEERGAVAFPELYSL